ncbi:MAG: carboxypeptidase regulatory-like domain-containing protein, partial [Chloroflexus sp.]
LQGSTLPPAGTPNYFVLFDDDGWGYTSQDQLQVWEFHVDWTTPANSTFTHSVDLATAPFDSNMCGYSRDCIPQPGTTQKLDAISDRLMFSLQYRNFGTHESMVVNHTVDVDNTDRAGIRWYELRKTSSTWSIHQQGTYSPDSADRWMGSISIDSAGNIALGYSVSSNSIYPSVRFTGRLASDPLGQMTQGENSIVEGGGSQLGVNRWGDYSAMMVDPADDCVFWYTQEYVSTTGSWNWATRIGAFKMPGCGADWGDLTGTVTDSNTSAPIANARVTITGGATTYTNASGQYIFTELPAGSYNITVTSYWYNAGSAIGVVVTDGNTTTQNFSLVPKPMVTISGTVTDGSLRPGYPLSATIIIPEYPGSPIYTDPSTGAYSVALAKGVTHHFTVTSPGYLDGTATITPVSNLTLDFALIVDSIACSAPGYVFEGFSEDFEAAFPPPGWSVVDNAGNGVVWDTNVAWGDNNYTGGSGMAATVNSDAAGQVEFDTELISPTLDPTTLPSLTLTYLANYQNFAHLDYLDLDIKVGSGGWTNLLRWNEDHGEFKATPGETVSQDLSAYATAPFQLRWHYYDPNSNDWDW